MSTSFVNYGPEPPEEVFTASDIIGGTPDNPFSSIDINRTDQGYLSAPANPGFDFQLQPIDPTNTGDTGGPQNISTPANAGLNNPETGGGTSFGAALGAAINAGFAAWQLSSQPKGTPKTVTTQVGGTRVVSGAPGLGSIFGTTSTGQINILPILIIGLIIVLILKYR